MPNVRDLFIDAFNKGIADMFALSTEEKIIMIFACVIAFLILMLLARWID